MEFKASYLEIEPRELIEFLLRESGHADREAVNPKSILDVLRLEHVTANFAAELPPELTQRSTPVRGMLSYRDRIVATDINLNGTRARFSVLHEVAHYVLPTHQHALYVCDETGMSFRTRVTIEQEANAFAADLLFLGDRFTSEVNSRPLTAATIKLLAQKYQASFEATARRMIERSLRPCMLVVCDNTGSRVDPDAQPVWSKKYTIASVPFRTKYFSDLHSAVIPPDVAAQVLAPGRDIADSVTHEVTIKTAAGIDARFRAEFFSNTYSIFCLLRPTAN